MKSNSYELVVVSPGISLDWDIVKPFRSAGKKIISEIEFSYSFVTLKSLE